MPISPANSPAALPLTGVPTTVDLQFDIRHFTPAQFGLHDQALAGTFGAQLKASLHSLDLKHPLGEIVLSNLNISSERRNTTAYHLNHLQLTAQAHPKRFAPSVAK